MGSVLPNGLGRRISKYRGPLENGWLWLVCFGNVIDSILYNVSV